MGPDEAKSLPRLQLMEEETVTILNIVDGVFSPIEGPMGQADFISSVEEMRLPNDVPWPIPVVLHISETEAKSAPVGTEVALAYGADTVGVLSVEEVFGYDKKHYCSKVFGTSDLAHPGVSKTMGADSLLVAGKISLVERPSNPFETSTLSPKETRVLFEEKGWKTVCAFQTRNAPHIGHEYLQKTALSFTDGVFINPVIGKKKAGDFKDEVILEAYKALVAHYFPPQSTVLSILRYEMQYAGPKEAIMHAIMRKNFGCTHIAIGRDHAGVGNFYRPYEAQEIFKEFPDLGITPIFFKEFFYCTRCAGMANERICPHPEDSRLTFSGTRLRAMFEAGERPPKEFMRPEVSEVILRHPAPFVEAQKA